MKPPKISEPPMGDRKRRSCARAEMPPALRDEKLCSRRKCDLMEFLQNCIRSYAATVPMPRPSISMRASLWDSVRASACVIARAGALLGHLLEKERIPHARLWIVQICCARVSLQHRQVSHPTHNLQSAAPTQRDAIGDARACVRACVRACGRCVAEWKATGADGNEQCAAECAPAAGRLTDTSQLRSAEHTYTE